MSKLYRFADRFVHFQNFYVGCGIDIVTRSFTSIQEIIWA